MKIKTAINRYTVFSITAVIIVIGKVFMARRDQFIFYYQ